MTKPALVDHDETVDVASTSYLIQSGAKHIEFIQTSDAYIYNESDNDTLAVAQTVQATINDQAQGMHLAVDPSTLLTTVLGFQNDHSGMIELSSYSSMAAVARSLTVLPGYGTVLAAEIHGPIVMSFPDDYNVQISQFRLKSDSTSSPAMSATDAEIYRLYAAAFGRTPDPGGQTYWSSQLAGGNPITQIAECFTGSAEFHADYAAVGVRDFVSDLYQNILHRAGDPSGAQYWAGQLNAGASQANVLVAFADSPENRMLTAPATG